MQLRSTAEKWPVVLLPSHRSYLDFLLVSYVMFEHNIKLPYIAAGQGRTLDNRSRFYMLTEQAQFFFISRFHEDETSKQFIATEWGILHETNIWGRSSLQGSLLRVREDCTV